VDFEHGPIIPHVLKVRIIADLEDRVRLEMEREGIQRDEALAVIQRDDHERIKWSQYLYGIDTRDPSLYDLVIHIHKFNINDAVDMICQAAKLAQFQTTPETREAIDDLALAAHVRAALTGIKPDLRVSARNGSVWVKTEAPILKESALAQEILRAAENIPGVLETNIDIIPSGVEAIG
jgi:hypothetical protein